MPAREPTRSRLPRAAALPSAADGRRRAGRCSPVVLVALVLVAARGSAPTSAARADVALRARPDRGRAARRPRSPRRIRAALAPLVGDEPRRASTATPAPPARRRVAEVADARFDRDFPHTLTVAVAPERPVAVLRRGRDAWLVSARGRVLRAARRRASYPRLPRIWLARAVDVVARSRRSSDAGRAERGRGGRAARPLRVPGAASRQVRDERRRSSRCVLALGHRAAPRRHGRPAAEARDREAAPASVPTAPALPRRQRPRAAGRRAPTLKSEVEVEGLLACKFALTAGDDGTYPAASRAGLPAPIAQVELQVEHWTRL